MTLSHRHSRAIGRYLLACGRKVLWLTARLARMKCWRAENHAPPNGVDWPGFCLTGRMAGAFTLSDRSGVLAD
jgi:hypothetical protein